MDVKQLAQVRQIDQLIQTKQEQLERLEALACHITPTLSHTGGCAGGTKDKLGDTVVRIVDMQREIDTCIDELVNLKQEASDMLGLLRDMRLRTILEMRYILGYDWDKIADCMGYSPRQTRRLHVEALNEFEKLSANVRKCP